MNSGCYHVRPESRQKPPPNGGVGGLRTDEDSTVLGRCGRVPEEGPNGYRLSSVRDPTLLSDSPTTTRLPEYVRLGTRPLPLPGFTEGLPLYVGLRRVSGERPSSYKGRGSRRGTRVGSLGVLGSDPF